MLRCSSRCSFSVRCFLSEDRPYLWVSNLRFFRDRWLPTYLGIPSSTCSRLTGVGTILRTDICDALRATVQGGFAAAVAQTLAATARSWSHAAHHRGSTRLNSGSLGHLVLTAIGIPGVVSHSTTCLRLRLRLRLGNLCLAEPQTGFSQVLRRGLRGRFRDD